MGEEVARVPKFWLDENDEAMIFSARAVEWRFTACGAAFW